MSDGLRADPRVDVRIAVMGALELALDVAYHDGPTARDLAIASEAYRLAGYCDEAATAISHATRDEIVVAIDKARYCRRRALLKADGTRMLATFTMLAEQGVLTWANCSEASRQRWLARGGHGRAGAVLVGDRQGQAGSGDDSESRPSGGES